MFEIYGTDFFDAYALDINQVIKVKYAGATGHDMIDYFVDIEGNHYRSQYRSNLKKPPKTDLPLMYLFHINNSVGERREQLVKKCQEFHLAKPSFGNYLLMNLLESCTDREYWKLEKTFEKLKESKV